VVALLTKETAQGGQGTYGVEEAILSVFGIEVVVPDAERDGWMGITE
jgi:hypothetical protein